MEKKVKAKENNKKNKKKNKKSRKILKTILLIILIIALGYACWFGYQYYRHIKGMEGSNYDPLSATALGIDPEKLKNVGRINILILGESGVGDGYKLTDTIMIASYNPQTQQASLLSIPRDTYVGKKDKDTATPNYLASYKMNSVYRNGTNIDETIECVNKLTGLDLQYYILVDTDAIIEIVDAIGGVYFNVPIDMDYDDLNQDLHIHLKAGEQLIDGAKAEQLLRFRHNQDGTSYPTEYGDNDLGRMRTQREFIQETAKQLLKIENATKVVNLLDIVFNNVKTNLDIQTLKYYVPYAFKFNTQNIQTGTLPGVPEQCNGIWIYTANKKQTKTLVEELFTDKVEEEEDTTNTISNTTTNTTITSSIATNTVSNATTTTEIKVELLNGTDDSNVLSKVKENLQKKGYTISKTGTTSPTSKTTIINRTSQSTSKEKEIKEILGVGAITSGSNNTKVDFTIIIGKDYK